MRFIYLPREQFSSYGNMGVAISWDFRMLRGAGRNI